MRPNRTYRRLLLCCVAWLLVLPVSSREVTSCLPVIETPAADNELDFSFFGKSLRAARLKTVKVESVMEFDVLKAWNAYKKANVDAVLTSLRSLSNDLGLNDWFMFELVRSYADELLGDGTPMDRVVLEHYLLVSMGYDVRLARTQRQLLLLVPIEQAVYEHSFVRVDGKDYYLFYDDLESDGNEVSVIYPCDPSKKDLGKGQSLSLLFEGSPLKVRSGQDKVCELDDGQIRIVCTINEGVMEMLRNYPLMDLDCYVTSVVLPQFQHSILDQLKPQIEDMTQCDAANALLHFVQQVFAYENDCDSHGHEKAYFIEENFYYDMNDCEDRSILYAFLVRSLLDLDVQIVEYPGHECTAVHFTDCLTLGNGYYFGGNYYLICDPSYVGASIGKCMPKYRSFKPQVYVVEKTSLAKDRQTKLCPRLDKRIKIPEISLNQPSL